MQSEQEIKKAAARDKVVSKAGKWAESRKARAAATGEEKKRAIGRHRIDGDELAEAVEKYNKEK